MGSAHAEGSIRLVVNGKRREVPDGTTVSALISELGLRDRNVVVELNREPLDRGDYGSVRLASGDVIEIVRAVAGGSGCAAGAP